MHTHLITLSVVTISILLSTNICAVELLVAGDQFPELQAQDQHGNGYQFEKGTKTLLIAFDMAAAKAANKYLSKQTTNYLSDNGIIFISNIHGMPGIGRFFALPKMRKYPYRIILADSEHLLDPFPRQQNQLTVIRLDNSAVIVSITFWTPAQGELAAMLASSLSPLFPPELRRTGKGTAPLVVTFRDEQTAHQ